MYKHNMSSTNLCIHTTLGEESERCSFENIIIKQIVF